jgi:signal transduction histidine kinase
VILRDITERKSAERRLQRLSRRLLTVQDEERRRIARELHDSTAQTMAALSMQLSALAREDPPPSEARRRQLLADCRALADEATSELRTTAYLLHPPLLEERGLAAAITWFISGFAERSGLKVKLEIATDFARLPTDVETAIFRIVQESLHNVHRHSGSSRAEVSLTRREHSVVLKVRDYGRGPSAASAGELGVGIVGIRERLLQLGGTLAIEPADPGMVVLARLPVAP